MEKENITNCSKMSKRKKIGWKGWVAGKLYYILQNRMEWVEMEELESICGNN